jgi:hypothetical protein
MNINEFFDKMPFKRLAEAKIPSATREKFPVLNKAIPFANQIVSGLAVVVVVLIIANSGGGGGGRAAPSSDFTYDLSQDDGGKSVVIKTYTGKGGAVVIPEKIEGLPVSTLAYAAFYGENSSSYGPGYNITSVVIPASVKFIDAACFSTIEGLTSVTILGTDVEIRGIAFQDCINLSKLNFPNGDNVLKPGQFDPSQKDVIGDSGSSAFYGCKKLPLAVRSKLNEWGFTQI